MKRGGNPPDLPPLIKPAAPPSHHLAPIALLVLFMYRSHHPCRATPSYLASSTTPRTNATNRQPTTKISTYNNVCLLFIRRTDFTLSSAFIPSLTLLAVSTPTAPRSFKACCTNTKPSKKVLNIWPFSQSRWTIWVALRLPVPALSHHPISTLPLRSYRHLTRTLDIHILFFIFSAQYLTHSPGAMHSALTLIAQLSSI